MEGPKISGHVNGIKQSSKPCNSSSAVKRYQAWWPFPDGATGSEADEARRNREQNTNQVAIDYYEVVTSSYERGWGQHFHYCPMIPGKSIEESITEYEVLVGKLTSLKADMKVLDIGCGVCGPARTIAKSFGCEIVGLVNSNRLVKRGTTLNEEAGLTHLISIVEGDFHHLPFADDTFDAAYAFESMCYAPDLRIPFRELRRVLKPGASFGHANWVMMESFDASVDKHRLIRDGIERGNGLPRMPLISDVRTALSQCGFVNEFEENMESRSKPGPWYYPLLGKVRYATCFKDFLRTVTMERKFVVPLFEAWYRTKVRLSLAPGDLLGLYDVMKTCTMNVAQGSIEGIFSPMVVFVSRNSK